MASTSGPTEQTSAPADRAIDVVVAERLAAVLRALADPLRLRILSVVATSPAGEATAGEAASVADVTAPTVSHHLRVLREVGVLEQERRGTRLFYRIPPTSRAAVTALLDSFAPAATSVAATAPAKLPDADAALARSAALLVERHRDLGGGLVTQTVRESYAALVRTAQAGHHVPVLAERFAAQRLEDLRRAAAPDAGPPPRPQVLFVCVANAGRSQLAAALLHRHAGGRIVARSAGTSPAQDVHAAVRPLLAELVDEGDVPFPKPLTDDAVRAADVVVTLGCGDSCPVLPGKRYEDWAVGDPALASPAGARAVRDDLDRRVRALVTELLGDD